jgi:hypothetical protein
MNPTTAQAPIKSASIKAVVLNADGTVKKDLGTVSYWHRNPLKRLLWMIRQNFK